MGHFTTIEKNCFRHNLNLTSNFVFNLAIMFLHFPVSGRGACVCDVCFTSFFKRSCCSSCLVTFPIFNRSPLSCLWKFILFRKYGCPTHFCSKTFFSKLLFLKGFLHVAQLIFKQN